MKIITLLGFFLLYPYLTTGQNNIHAFQLDCDDNIQFDSILIFKKYIRHKIISLQHLNHSTYSYSEIILPDFNKFTENSILPKLFEQLGTINNIDEFIAFTNCGARAVYISTYAPGSKERNLMENSFIGIFKSMSKNK